MTTKIGGPNQGIMNAAWGVGFQQGLSVKDAELVQTTAANVLSTTSTSATSFDPEVFKPGRSLMDIFNLAVNGYSTPTPPVPGDSSHPSGSLKTDSNGVITTPGGYKIQATSQFEWKITGPDGKSTRVWGDPHVDEGDGGKWDFKRDSTFVLGDGTRINVSTAPYGNNGMTVTKGLEIISGNDRVKVTDIDKGKGKTGQVTHDGFQHVNSFAGKDVFVMGKETDDWSYKGKEIIGSENGGDSFKLGNDLAPGEPHPSQPSQPGSKPPAYLEQLTKLFDAMTRLFDSMRRLAEQLEKLQTLSGNKQVSAQGGQSLAQRQALLRRNFEDIGRMLDLHSSLVNLSRSVQQRYLMA